MRANSFNRTAISIALTLSLAAGSALAAPDADKDGPSTIIEQGTIHFAPTFKAAGYQLRVTGPESFTELENAHICIEQLNERIDKLEVAAQTRK